MAKPMLKINFPPIPKPAGDYRRADFRCRIIRELLSGLDARQIRLRLRNEEHSGKKFNAYIDGLLDALDITESIDLQRKTHR